MSALRQTLIDLPTFSRFTAPAPALATQVTAYPTALPVARVTALPAHDMSNEEALLEQLTPDAPVTKALPLDLTVPRRTVMAEGFAPTLSHRAACLLLHVDGSSTLADIAAHTSLPANVVFEIFVELLGAGAVELDAADAPRSTPPAPESGVFRKSHAPGR